MTKLTSKPIQKFDCIVVGGGPGGLISALYLCRFKRSTLLVCYGKPRAAWGPKVHNLIGYHQGISGRSLLRRIHRQLKELQTLRLAYGKAVVTKKNNLFNVRVGETSFIAKKVILATGITDAQPDLDNLEQLRRAGLLKYCSICDGYENIQRPIAVLAKDDGGMQKALFLANWTKKITIFIPEKFKPSPQKIHASRKIKAKIVPYQTLSIQPLPLASGISITVNGQRTYKPYTGAYVELGCSVNDEAFKNLRGLRRSAEGFIITGNEQRTSIKGLFAVGDCVNLLGQISVAAGQAAIAATAVHNDLL